MSARGAEEDAPGEEHSSWPKEEDKDDKAKGCNAEVGPDMTLRGRPKGCGKWWTGPRPRYPMDHSSSPPPGGWKPGSPFWIWSGIREPEATASREPWTVGKGLKGA